MERIGKDYGRELPEADKICPEFEDGSDEQMDLPASLEALKRSSGRRWYIPVICVCIALLVVALIWQPLFLRLLPHAYLGWTINRTGNDLSKRVEDSPVSLIKTAANCLEKGNMTFAMDYSNSDNPSDENYRFDLSFSGDVENKQWQADFNYIKANQFCVDLSAFANDRYICAGSDSLTDGKRFGVTYASIQQDLRNSIFGNYLTEAQIENVTNLVDLIETTTGNAGPVEEIMKPYSELMVNYIKNLKPSVGRANLEINGRNRKCDTMAFTIDRTQFANLLEQLQPLIKESGFDTPLVNTDPNVTIGKTLDSLQNDLNVDLILTFYFFGNKVAGVKLDLSVDKNDITTVYKASILLNFGSNASNNDIIVSYSFHADGITDKGKFVSSVEKNEDGFKERLSFDLSKKNIDLDVILYWNREAGKMDLCYSGSCGEGWVEDTLSFVLKEDCGGFTLGIENLAKWPRFLSAEGLITPDEGDISLEVSLSPNCEIRQAQYINLDKITQKDIWDVIKALHSLSV